jgi:hypothetical protein
MVSAILKVLSQRLSNVEKNRLAAFTFQAWTEGFQKVLFVL